MNDLRIFGLLFIMSLLMITCTTAPLFAPEITGPEGVGNPCPEGVVSFTAEVFPIISSNCAFSGCHDAQTAADDIVLDSYNNILKEVEPGKPNNSELYESIIDSEDDIMPPPPYAPLNSNQIALIRDWIDQGAEETTCGIPCDPTDFSFATAVFPIMENLCIGCHNDNLASGEINLKNYDNILPYALDGSLLGSIEHATGYFIMPPSGEKLADCQILQISGWIDAGALNN